MSEAADKLRAKMAEHGITVDTVFVPFSKSRNAKPSPKTHERSLNWRVTLKKDGRDVYASDYSAGIGHCPSYRARKWPEQSYEARQLIEYETEHGKPGFFMSSAGVVASSKGKPIMPDAADVLSAFLMDGEAIEYARYEDYAREFGYDEDSRKGEQVYRVCLECGLALRSAFGEKLLAELRELAREL